MGVEGWRRRGALGDGKQNLGAKWLRQMKWKEESHLQLVNMEAFAEN